MNTRGDPKNSLIPFVPGPGFRRAEFSLLFQRRIFKTCPPRSRRIIKRRRDLRVLLAINVSKDCEDARRNIKRRKKGRPGNYSLIRYLCVRAVFFGAVVYYQEGRGRDA